MLQNLLHLLIHIHKVSFNFKVKLFDILYKLDVFLRISHTLLKKYFQELAALFIKYNQFRFSHLFNS